MTWPPRGNGRTTVVWVGRAVLLAVLHVPCAGCGLPREGDACGPRTPLLCEPSGQGALVCEEPRFLAVPCPGPLGCRMDAGALAGEGCDVRGTPTDTPCPQTWLGATTCSPDSWRLECARTDGGAFRWTNTRCTCPRPGSNTVGCYR